MFKTLLGTRLLFILLMLTAIGLSASADSWSYPESKPETPFDGGTGTINDPYRIATAQQLANFAWMVNDGTDFEDQYVVLTADITLNTIRCSAGTHRVVNIDTYTPWVMIGHERTISDDNFEGTFDGRGHKIIGLYIRDNGAFFRKVSGGTVRNVVFDTPFCYNEYVRDSDNNIIKYNAAIVSMYAREASFINCKVENAIVDGYHFEVFGGILNTNRTSSALTTDNVVLTKCSFHGYVTLRHYADYFGCIVGRSRKYDTDWYISECTASGEIVDYAIFNTTQVYYGGIMGYADNNVNISKCINYVDYTHHVGEQSSWASIGGILGFSIDGSKVTISECANLGKISLYNSESSAIYHERRIGGIAGKLTGETTISNCASLASIYTKLSASGGSEGWKLSHFVGCVEDKTVIDNCVVVGDTSEDSYPVSSDHYDPLCRQVGSDGTFDCTNVYYNCTRNTTNGTLYAATSVSGASQCSLEQLQADAMISTLNSHVPGTVWGRYNNDESAFNSMPLPISCGGVVTMIAGGGTADNPYLIYNEAELRAIVSAVHDGNCMEGKYFRLADDIDMSSDLLPAIGTRDYPFKGTFDGNGHYISGIVSSRGSLFGYLAGTVKNLALFNFTAQNRTYVAPIASMVGGYYSEYGMESGVVHYGSVSSCYVLADINAVCDASSTYSNFNTDVSCAGVCGTVYEGCSVSDCYFIGSLSTTLTGEAPSGWTPTFTAKIGGVIINNYGSVDRCFAILSTSTSGDFSLRQICGTYYSNHGDGTINDCYYITDSEDVIERGTRLDSYAELNTTFGAMEAFGRGLQLPYLLNAKHYQVKADGAETVIDGARLPLSTPNMIRTYTDDSDEAHLWTLANMAIYRADTKWINVVNCDLVPGYDFKFDWVSQSTYGAKGAVNYTLELDGRGWYGLCLPCDIKLEDLPDGSELYYVGKKATNTINMIKVNDISAGTPCVAHIDGTGTLVLKLNGSVTTSPGHVSGLTDAYGLFANTDLSNVAVFEVDAEGNPIFKHYDNIAASPFSIYLKDSDTDFTVISREELYLDSSYNANTGNINVYSGQQVPVVLRASYPAGQWNPIVLPFDMSVETAIAAFGSEFEVEEMKFMHYDSATNGLTLFFGRVNMTDIQCDLLAGHAYLIKPSTDFVSDSEFAAMLISSNLAVDEFVDSSDQGDFTLKVRPYFDYGALKRDTDETIYIYDPAKDIFKQRDRYVGYSGLSFYVTVQNYAPTVLNIYHGVTSGVESPTSTEAEVVGIYDLSGRRLAAPQPGVNILLMSDGSARKILRTY